MSAACAQNLSVLTDEEIRNDYSILLSSSPTTCSRPHVSLSIRSASFPRQRIGHLNTNDLLFYISETSMPMATFMRKHGLFMDGDGLHFDLAQFNAIRDLAEKSHNRTRGGQLRWRVERARPFR